MRLHENTHRGHALGKRRTRCLNVGFAQALILDASVQDTSQARPASASVTTRTVCVCAIVILLYNMTEYSIILIMLFNDYLF